MFMRIKILLFAILSLTLNLFAQDNAGSGESANSSSSDAEFVYAGIRVDGGGLAGFRLDRTLGQLTEVPGSPVILNSLATSGSLATAQGFVYTENLPSNGVGRIFQYEAD